MEILFAKFITCYCRGSSGPWEANIVGYKYNQKSKNIVFAGFVCSYDFVNKVGFFAND